MGHRGGRFTGAMLVEWIVPGLIGETGDLSAVEKLRPLTELDLLNVSVRDVARTAIAAIQKRAGGEPGVLSVASEIGRKEVREILVGVFRVGYLLTENAIVIQSVWDGPREFPRSDRAGEAVADYVG